MFKVGDIVTLSDLGHEIYKTKLYKQTYIITWVSKINGVKVKGFTNGLEICYSDHIVKLDIDYLRRQKIQKLRSTKNIIPTSLD